MRAAVVSVGELTSRWVSSPAASISAKGKLKLKVSQFRNPSILGKVDGWSPYQAGTHIWQQGVKDVLRRPQRSGSSKPDGPEQWRSLAQGDAGKHPGLCISEPLAQ